MSRKTQHPSFSSLCCLLSISCPCSFKIKLFGPSWLFTRKLPPGFTISIPPAPPAPSLKELFSRLQPWFAMHTEWAVLSQGFSADPWEVWKTIKKASCFRSHEGRWKRGGPTEEERHSDGEFKSSLTFSSCPSTCPASDAASALIVSSSLFHWDNVSCIFTHAHIYLCRFGYNFEGFLCPGGFKAQQQRPVRQIHVSTSALGTL